MSDYECWKSEDIPIDDYELVEGYRDGTRNEPKPGPNRSAAYHHGWWAGASDFRHVPSPPWLMELAHQLYGNKSHA